MNIGKNELHIVKRAIEQWEQEGTITQEQANKLRANLAGKKTERQQLAQYFFLIAISCAILAFGAIFIDEKVLEKLKAYFALSNLFIATVSIALSGAWFWYIYKIRNRISNAAREIYLVTGTILSLISLVYFFKDIGAGPYYNRLLLASSIVILFISTLSRSKIVWLGGLGAFIAWFGAFSTWQQTDYLYFGMNYPTRLAALGVFIIILSTVVSRIPKTASFTRTTFISGILLFFASLWAVSIFGNYGHFDEWVKVRQSQVIIYSLLFGLCSTIAFYAGIRTEDNSLRDIAVLTILLNLYTRYFEYFWDHTNKGVFFLILAVSFYIVGKTLDKRKKTRKPA